MAPRPAIVSQADMARTLRAFRAVGQPAAVEFRPDGTVVVVPVDGPRKLADVPDLAESEVIDL